MAPINSKLQTFWGAVSKVESDLPEFVFLASIEDPFTGMTEGVVVEVPRHIAARRMVEGSHRIASESEVSEYQKRQVKASRSILRAERERRNRIADDPEAMNQQLQPPVTDTK